MAKKAKNIKSLPGDILSIDLGDGYFSYGLVLPSTIGFFDLKTKNIKIPNDLIKHQIFLNVWVMGSAIKKGIWPVIGHIDIPTRLLEKPRFYKQDPINGKLYITTNGEDETPATYEECKNLECAAVWEAGHIVDILNDHFSGIISDWFKTVDINKDKTFT